MPKSPEGYQPSKEEVKKAEGMMTPEQQELSEERALSLANEEVPDLNELSRIWEFHPYEKSGHGPRIQQLYHILGPERFAQEIRDEIGNNKFQDVVLAKRVVFGDKEMTQAEAVAQQQKAEEEYEKKYGGPASFHSREARERGLQNGLELYIEQGKRGLLASAIRSMEDRASQVAFLREHYPDEVHERETEEAIRKAIEELKSFREQYVDSAINNLHPNSRLDLRDALEALRGGAEDEKSRKVEQNVHDQLIHHGRINSDVQELLYLLGTQQYRRPEIGTIEHTLELVKKQVDDGRLFNPDLPFYPGDGRPQAPMYHEIPPVRIKLGLHEGKGGVEIEVNGWDQAFHRGQLDYVVVRSTDGREYRLWGDDAREVMKNKVPGFERAWTT